MVSVSHSRAVKGNAAGLSPLGVFDNPRYAQIAVERASEYQGAAPFPNICIDDFLPEDIAHALSASFPSHDDIGWIERDNKNNRRRYQHDETKLPHLLREMLREFNSRQFTLFLETLTGIDCLLPDPYFIFRHINCYYKQLTGNLIILKTTTTMLHIHLSHLFAARGINVPRPQSSFSRNPNRERDNVGSREGGHHHARALDHLIQC